MDQTLAGVGRERFRRPAANDPQLRCRSPNAQFTGRVGAGFYWGRKTGSGPDCANSRSNFQQTSASGKCRPVVADGTVRSQDAKIIRRRRARDQGSVSNAAEPFATVAKGSLRSRSRAAGAIIYRTPPCASPPVLRGSGTLMLIGQPAEETVNGAEGMVKDGLFTRFPRPDVVLALHVGNELPAGKVGVVPGVYDTNADSLRITIFGKGGHGASPHTTVDPIVIAARTILALQTIPSREVKPGEMAVITVGYIHAGTKNNIIPDQAELGLTVRTYKADVRKQVLAAIARITTAEAEAAAAPRAPSIDHYEGTDAVYNDPALARQLRAALEDALGRDNVLTSEPITASEDFSVFVEQGIPGFYLSLGGADPQKLALAQTSGTHLPSNHSPLFAPDVDPALHTAITAEVGMLRDLLKAEGNVPLPRSTGGESHGGVQ